MTNKFLSKSILAVAMILLPTIVSAAPAYEVHAWGYGDLLYNVLQATKVLIGSGNYLKMVQIALTIGIMITVLSLMNAKDFSIFMVGQKVVVGVLLYTFIVGSSTDVVITDHTTGKTRDIRSVPSVIGFPLYLFSNLERGASELFRTSLAMTEGSLTALGSVPVTTGYDLLYTASNYRIQDPKLNQTINQFIQNCVYPDVLSGFLDLSTLGSADFWQSLSGTTHPARISGIYDGTSDLIDGKLTPCTDVYDHLDDTLVAYTKKGGTGFKRLAASMGFLTADTVSSTLGTISKQSFGYGQNGSMFLKNAIAMNSFNDAYVQTASQVGIDSSALAYGMAKGSETTATQMTLSGIMAKKYMPFTKGFMTVILIALIPLILLIALATNSLRKPAGMIIGILTALSLWSIGAQLLDFFILIRTREMLETVSGAGGGEYSLTTKPIIDSSILDSINMAMSMYWMIPTLSFAVASMNGYAASQMMSGAGAAANSAVGGAAGEIATGSRSMGVVRENMMSANKYDGASSFNSGQSSQMTNSNMINAKNDYAASANSSSSQVDSYMNRSISNTKDEDHSGSTTTTGHNAKHDDSIVRLSGDSTSINNSFKDDSSTTKDSSTTDKSSVNIDQGTNLKGTMQSIIGGHSDAVERLQGMKEDLASGKGNVTPEEFESERRAVAAAISNDLSANISENKSTVDGVSMSGGTTVSAYAGTQVDAGTPLSGILGSGAKITAGGKVEADFTGRLSTNSTRATQQNEITNDLYEILGSSNDYQKDLSSYIDDKLDRTPAEIIFPVGLNPPKDPNEI